MFNGFYTHDDIIKWKHFPRYWPFVWGIHRSLVNSPQKGQWCGALMFSLICAWINGRVNNREAGDLRCHRSHYDVTVMPKHHSNESYIRNYNIPWMSIPMLHQCVKLIKESPIHRVFTKLNNHSREVYGSTYHDCMLLNTQTPTGQWNTNNVAD